jgi:hypothetical protein
MQHAVGANEGVLPGGLAEQAGLMKQGDRLNDEPIEGLHQNLFHTLVGLDGDGDAQELRVLAQSGQEIAQAAFGGEDSVSKAKTAGPSEVVGFLDLL